MDTAQSNTKRNLASDRPNAERWFNESNRNLSGVVDATFSDDDPPFYLKHIPLPYSNDTRTKHSHQLLHRRVTSGKRNLRAEPAGSLGESSKSNSEEFRDVIDDLTIQNKKLRRRLKKYEAPHCSHLEKEKLFEVRFHGLAAHKKRELDDLLRGFAASIEEPPEKPVLNAPDPQTLSVPPPLPPPAMKKPASSTTSNSLPIDSAYASISNSGQTQTSNSQVNERGPPTQPVQTAQSKQENVKSYLDDMPRGLMPKYSLIMSERSKRKLIVRRLEELFGGKGAASSEHSQSHQQQEVSLSAAKADQGALGARGRQPRMEGLRESRISTVDADALTEHMSDASLQSRKESIDRDGSAYRDIQVSQNSTPDQRPTRPLDLDLYRAQVPGDNLQYIRHLGSASPTSKTDPYTNTADGWVYLNLLVNMAQLHTFNVTPEFVRKSITDISTKLELSPDGRKIRWKGSTEESKARSDSDSGMEDENGGSLGEEGSRSQKRRKLGVSSWDTPGHDLTADLSDLSQCSSIKSSANLGGSSKLRPVFLGQTNNTTKLSYKPIFFHGSSSEEEEDDWYDEGSPSNLADNDTGAEITCNGRQDGRTRLSRDQKGETGPIIFYNRLNFCTDLSRDLRAGIEDCSEHSTGSPEPIGFMRSKPQYRERHAEECKGPITGGIVFSDQMDLDHDRSSIIKPLIIFTGTDSQSHATVEPVQISMEASGLGGIQPTDHFLVEVQVQNKTIEEPDVHNNSFYGASQAQPHRLLNGASSISGRSKVSLVQSSIISVNTRQLRPSSLPPPSYIHPQASSSFNTDESSVSETLSESQTGRRAWPSSTAEDASQSAQPSSSLSSFGRTGEESPSGSSSAVQSDDSSIDLLAHARELDPEAIAAREREFEQSRQQLLEAQADSSAATAGDDSGNVSDDSVMEEGSSSSQEKRSSAKRKRVDGDSSTSQRQPSLERDGSDGDVDARFTSSGMEESD